MSDKTSWDPVNQLLLSKGWTYYESEQGDTDKYSTITWSYDKNDYSDKAKGWFYLYTYNGLPNKVYYQVFNKQPYFLIQKALSSYKVVKSDVRDDYIMTTYEDAKHYITITTEKTENEEYGTAITAYTITVINRAGVYDADNGKKAVYWEDSGTIKAEYTLRNGQIQGETKTYYENGRLERIGHFVNGKMHGKFIDYDEEGNKVEEFNASNGMRNGLTTLYEDGRVSETFSYLNDEKNGVYNSFYYDDEGQLRAKYTGAYLNGNRHGLWQLIYLKEEKPRVISFENYVNDRLNGPFQSVQKDTVIVANYVNGNLEGPYKRFHDFNRWLTGSVINTDLAKLQLVVEGEYRDSLRNGHWRYYDIVGSLTMDGNYVDDRKHGEWKYYYPKYVDANSKETEFANKLYLIATYSHGKLHGKSVRYSEIESTPIPCVDSESDTCFQRKFIKMTETLHYKYDDLDGPYLLVDSTGAVQVSGGYSKGKRSGEWTIRHDGKDKEGTPYHYFEKGTFNAGLRDGRWSSYFEEGFTFKTQTFKSDVLEGEAILWASKNIPEFKMQYAKGRIIELLSYDSIGKLDNKYEITDVSSGSFRCQWTHYYPSEIFIQNVLVQQSFPNDPYVFMVAFSKAVTDDAVISDGPILYTSNGRKLLEGTYLNDRETDVWTYYYYDQNMKLQKLFSKGQLQREKFLTLDDQLYTGDFIFDDKESGLRIEYKIKNGVKDGKAQHVDPKTNKVIKKETFKGGILKT